MVFTESGKYVVKDLRDLRTCRSPISSHGSAGDLQEPKAHRHDPAYNDRDPWRSVPVAGNTNVGWRVQMSRYVVVLLKRDFERFPRENCYYLTR